MGARHRRRQGRRRADAHPVTSVRSRCARGSTSSRGSARPELFVLNVLLVTLGLGALTATARTVAGAGRLPRRHADRGDRVPLPGRGRHQAVPRRAARSFLRHRRHGARPRGRLRRTWPGSRCCCWCRWSPSSCSSSRWRALFGSPLSTALRTGFYLAQAGELALVMLALATQNALIPRELAQPVLAAMILSMLLGAAHHPVRRADRAQADRQRLAGARGAGDADRGEDDVAAGSHHHLRLRPQRPEPRAPARGRGHSLHRARLGSGARARGGGGRRRRRLRRREPARGADVGGTVQGQGGRDHVRRHAGRRSRSSTSCRSCGRSCR